MKKIEEKGEKEGKREEEEIKRKEMRNKRKKSEIESLELDKK